MKYLIAFLLSLSLSLLAPLAAAREVTLSPGPHGSIMFEWGAMEVYVLDDWCYLFVRGVSLQGPYPVSMLGRLLPGSTEEDTAGSTSCYITPASPLAPGLGGWIVHLRTVGTGSHMGAAIGSYKQQIADLKKAGYVPVACP